MEGQSQLIKSRVVKVTTEESWKSSMTEAKNQGCPAFVHFTASWCAPSVAMNPFLQELAHNFHDVLFFVVDVDEVKALAKRFDVKAMPTFMLLKEDKMEAKIVGANPDEIRKMVASYVNSNRP